MKRILSAGTFGLLLLIGLVDRPAVAQREEDVLPPIDWWDHGQLASHVDTFSGKVWVRAESSGRVIVVLDQVAGSGERDGKVDRVFVFTGHDGSLGELNLLDEMGTVKFWHDGMRVSLPDLGASIELRLQDSTLPRTARSWGRPTAASSEGISLVEKSGAVVEQLVVDDPLVFAKMDDCSSNPDTCIDQQDYGSTGGGGGCAKSCSVGCGQGRCSTTCSSGQGWCVCGSDGRPICSCISC